MKMPRAALAGLVFLAVASLATPQRSLAQAPPGSDTISLRAVAESLKVLDQLSKVVKANPKDTAAWYHRAMVAFVLAARADRREKVPGLDYHQLRIIGGDSFTALLNLAPDNSRYKISASHFRLTDHLALGRALGRPRECDANLDHYKSEPDSALRLTLMLDMGSICWMDYDGYEGRGLSSLAEATSANPLKLIAPPSVFAAALNSRLLSSLPCLGSIPIPIIMEDALDSVVATLGPVPFEVAGEADYLRGKRLFEAAHDFDPSNERAYRSLAMLYAARNNWEDLAQLARRQTQVTPGNPWTWMTLALATYRTHPGKEVEPMFDTAFARLDQKERDRLDRLERVLRPPDAPRFHLETPESRAGIANTWWMLADPLWSSQHASARTEFLARVTYAELRWSLDAWHVRGADTDRGDIYIRYGPPSKVVGWVDSGADTAFKDAAMHTFWIYDAHLIFAFDKRLHMGTANAFGCDRIINDRIKAWQPARWDNIPTAHIDSMPTQVARFRSGDSVDVFLATLAPVRSMQGLTELSTAPTAHFWLFARGASAQFTDSVTVGSSGALQWTRRVRPGPYYYRVESMIPNTLVAGRTAATLLAANDTSTGFRMLGFGLSDVLIASRAESRALPRRWTDVDVTPILGDITKGSTISLVWETYELGQRGTSAQYDVAVAIERERSKAGAIAASIVGVIGGAAGITTTKDKVTMKFERTVPFAPIITENISVALGQTPPGSYRLTVQITDKVSGRTSSRVSRIVIKE